MAPSARLIAWYPYATPAELKSGALGAARLTPQQIEDYARQIAKLTYKAGWAIDTNTVGVFIKIADCADQDAVAQRAVTGLVGNPKTVQGSLAEARRIRALNCTPPVMPLAPMPEAGMSTTVKILLGVLGVAIVGTGAWMFARPRR